MKRCVDIVISLIGLTILMPLSLIVAILIKTSSKGPVFFKHERIGKGFKPFIIYKFRTMVVNAQELGPSLTIGEDNRVTKIGRFLRQIKLDELPQLFNVLKGDMSLVGPRPEVKRYVDAYKEDYREILKVRPGITDLASIKYRNESSLLSQSSDTEGHYLNVILPEKIRLAKNYIKDASFLYDIRLGLFTLFYLIYPKNTIDKLLEYTSRYRLTSVVLVQGILITLANFLAFYIRFEENISEKEYHLFICTLPFLLALRFGFFYLFGLFRGLWTYVSIKDLQNIAASVTLSSLSFIILVRGIVGLTSYPRSVYILDWLITITFLGGIRLMKRLHDARETKYKSPSRVLVIGGETDATEKVLREIMNPGNYHYNVIGLIDDDPYKKGLRIHNVPILGTMVEVEEIIREKDPNEILVAMPDAPSNLMRQIVSECRKFGKPIKIIPGLKDILFGKKLPFLIRNIEPEDVLFRGTAFTDLTGLKPFFEGKRVMITGAGGTIGSEISRQIAGYNPSQLILFERHEGSLYNVEIGLRDTYPEALINPIIGDITDLQRVTEVIGSASPQIIFHAAANKHVPMMELNPSEAIKTNILGTWIVAEAASKFGVEVFVLISTDKAVNPVSVMGVSKRAAELTLQGMNGANKTRFITVRFGNVLESSGSVVPRFKEQLRKGGPITVTHPDVTRYFMTLTEAVQLLLQAATMGKGGEVFVLDMGEPVKVLDVANILANLYGFTPGKNIEIVFTGLRQGEKLSESLFNNNEKVEKTSHPKVLAAVNEVVGKEEGNGILKSLRLIEEAVSKGSVPDALNVIKDLVPAYQPQPNRSITLGVGETNLMEVNR